MRTDIDFIQVLFFGNPKEFNKLVGGNIETYSSHGKDTHLWVVGYPTLFEGKTIIINTETLRKKCFLRMQQLKVQANRADIPKELFVNLLLKFIDNKDNMLSYAIDSVKLVIDDKNLGDVEEELLRMYKDVTAGEFEEYLDSLYNN